MWLETRNETVWGNEEDKVERKVWGSWGEMCSMDTCVTVPYVTQKHG